METQEITATNNIALSPADILEHWQGHRNLTRRVIEAFPEDRLFDFHIGSMRTFADIAMELNHMAAPGAHGVATGEWKELSELLKDRDLNPSPTTKAGILEIWDWGTSHMNTIWGELKPGRSRRPTRPSANTKEKFGDSACTSLTMKYIIGVRASPTSVRWE